MTFSQLFWLPWILQQEEIKLATKVFWKTSFKKPGGYMIKKETHLVLHLAPTKSYYFGFQKRAQYFFRKKKLIDS